jgi:hypothetical protein
VGLTRRWFSGTLWATSGHAMAATLPARAAAPAAYRLDAPAATDRSLAERAADLPTVLDFGADPSGRDDASAAFQAGIDFVAGRGGGELLVPAGHYLVGEVELRARTYLVGLSRFTYGSARFLSPSVLVRPVGAGAILRAARTGGFGLEQLEFDGNPDAGDSGDGLAFADCGSIVIRQCKFARFAVGIETFPEGGSRYSGDLHVVKSMFRNNRIGLRLGQDSQVEGSDFSANAFCGAYVNAGQARLLGCRFEWNRDGERGAADGIHLHRNANEITIANCTFDRNAGCDLRATGAEAKRPRHIQVVGNLFKRAGWGRDAEPSASALVTDADDVTFTGNLYQFAGHEPAPTQGMPSPLQAAAFTRCTRVVFQGNALGGVGAMLALQPPNYAWVRSGSGWYLTRPRNEGGRPWLREPLDVVLRPALPADETVGAATWRNADWSFGDPDGLGYDTVHLRRDDPALHEVFAVLAASPVGFADCADVQTDDVRDSATLELGVGEPGRSRLRTRLLGWPGGTRVLHLSVALQAEEAVAAASFELVLGRRAVRPVAATCTTRLLEPASTGPAIDVAGTDAAVTLDVRPKPLGDEVELILRNRTSAAIVAGLALLW